MPNALDISKKTELKKFGFSQLMTRDYGLMLEGFDNHQLTLLCHSHKPNQNPSIPMRIGNPAQIDNGEADYLVRKMLAGYYPWTEEECMERTFEGKSGKKVQGCQWCRERQETFGLSGVAASASPEQAQESVSPEFPDSHPEAAPPVITLEEVVCVHDGYHGPLEDRNGKKRTQKQLKNDLRLHNKTKHKAALPTEGVPA